MAIFEYEFPWGIYIGDMKLEDDSIPFLIDTSHGGIVVVYDDETEKRAIDFIEQVTLSLLSTAPLGNIHVDQFDYGKKRFLYLAALEKANIYTVAFTQKRAEHLFEQLEELAQRRQYDYISIDTPTISEYNKKYKTVEPYHIVLMDLNDFPGDLYLQRRFKNFIEMAYESGIFIIAYYNKSDMIDTKAIKPILDSFPKIDFTHSKDQIKIDDRLIPHKELFHKYAQFEPIQIDKKGLVETLLSQHASMLEEAHDQDFLEIPIGKVGRDTLHFTLGQRSGAFSSFIAGMPGTGKSNLLHVLLTEIAKKYTAQEIELYLMDYNEGGVELYIHKHHPNVAKLFLNMNNPDEAYTMLQEFTAEMQKRAEIIKQASCTSIEEYNQKHSDKRLPHKILVIDEVQSMFSGDFTQVDRFNKIIIDIAKKGRKFGLHFIFATQNLENVQIDKAAISQIGLTISFRLKNKLDAMKIFDEDGFAIDQVTKLPKYHFVYKSPQKTVVAKANYIPKEEIEQILQNAAASRKPDEILTPEIIDGSKRESPKTQTDVNETATKSSQNIESSLYSDKEDDLELLKQVLEAKKKNPHAFMAEISEEQK